MDLGYEYEHLGETLEDLEELRLNNSSVYANRKNPLMILGTAPLYLNNGNSINDTCKELLSKWTSIIPNLSVNVLHTGANVVGGLENINLPNRENYLPGLYRLGIIFDAEGLPQDYRSCRNEVFVGASLSDATIQRSRIQLFLPRSTHFEQEGSLTNMAGTSQTIKPIISAGGDCLRTYDISL
jgi:hypothetical protein